ncbi:MAG: divalent-cation tolerance protein CutA [Prosthecobacter sp.]|jgi:periplasmic divalent cation tolerance protein|nr:divalent-cation tolerance protein CutA [Prosthecobacter sp.]
MSAVRLILCTFPDEATAARVGQRLVEERLAACVNLLPNARSIYRWQGSVETAHEVLALIKTAAERLPDLEQRLLALHPYEVPEILVLEPAHVSSAYQSWLLESVVSEQK